MQYLLIIFSTETVSTNKKNQI